MRTDSKLFLKRIIEESKKQNNYTILINLNDYTDIPGIGESRKDILEDLINNNCISSKYNYFMDATIELTLTIDGMRYFETKDEEEKQYKRNVVTVNNYTHIEGNNNNVNNYNSIEQDFSYSEAREIIKSINEYDKYFDIEFGENAERLRGILNESERLANNHEKLDTIKKLFGELKQIVSNVAQSVITNVILKQLSGF